MERAHGNRRLTAVAAVLALAASLVLALTPLAASESGTLGPGGAVERERSSETLVDSEGSAVVLVLAAPVLIAAAALAAQWTARARAAAAVAASLLVALALLGSASIGLFYWPAALAMVVVAARRPA